MRINLPRLRPNINFAGRLFPLAFGLSKFPVSDFKIGGARMTAYHPGSQGGFQRRYPATPDLSGMPSHCNPLVQDICKTLHLWPSEIDLSSKQGLQRVAAQIRRALREQRRRALASHWSYDIACHARLLELHGRLAKHTVITPAKRRTNPGSRRSDTTNATLTYQF